jgi:hypothetical protein
MQSADTNEVQSNIEIILMAEFGIINFYSLDGGGNHFSKHAMTSK